MSENSTLSLIQSIANSQKELLVLFKAEEHVLTNNAFNDFFCVSSMQDYNSKFGAIINNFVPHPSYFHKDKIENGESWFDAIMKLDDADRIVSMMTPSYDSYAFHVKIDSSVEDYRIVTFVDITRDLIKRIMIKNNVNIDIPSGAYDKKYFLQVAKNFDDAAVFNEKIIGAVLVKIDEDENPDFAYDEEALKRFVSDFKHATRQDDMLVRWDRAKFLLIYLVDGVLSSEQMIKKLENLIQNSAMRSLKCKLSSALQKEGESIISLLARLQS